MGDVSSRNRKQRSVLRKQKRENKVFSRFKKSAKYGSKLHRQRISQGILTKLYGRPIRGKYGRPRYRPRKVAGYNTPSKTAGIFYYRQRKKRRMARDGR